MSASHGWVARLKRSESLTNSPPFLLPDCVPTMAAELHDKHALKEAPMKFDEIVKQAKEDPQLFHDLCQRTYCRNCAATMLVHDSPALSFQIPIVRRLLFMKLICLLACTSLLSVPLTATSAVHDQGLAAGKLRTEYPSGTGAGSNWISLYYARSNNLEGKEGCLFDAVRTRAPNKPQSGTGCPGSRFVDLDSLIELEPEGSGDNHEVNDHWRGNLQKYEDCLGLDTGSEFDSAKVGDSFEECISYNSSPYFSLNSPSSAYWVVSANEDPAFDQCQEGPPNLSHDIKNFAVESEGLYNIKTTNYYQVGVGNRKRVHLKINAGAHNFYCDPQGTGSNLQLTFPFLAFGAQYGAGNNSPLGTLNRSTSSEDTLTFSMKRAAHSAFDCDDANCGNAEAGSHAGFFVTAEWAGPANPGDPSITFPRMIWVDLYRDSTVDNSFGPSIHTRWNWPVYDSFYWPGAEIVILSADEANNCAGVSVSELANIGTTYNYSVDLTNLFKCVSDDLGEFDTPLPSGNVNITGVHFYIEAAQPTSGYMEVQVSKVRID